DQLPFKTPLPLHNQSTRVAASFNNGPLSGTATIARAVPTVTPLRSVPPDHRWSATLFFFYDAGSRPDVPLWLDWHFARRCSARLIATVPDPASGSVRPFVPPLHPDWRPRPTGARACRLSDAAALAAADHLQSVHPNCRTVLKPVHHS